MSQSVMKVQVDEKTFTVRKQHEQARIEDTHITVRFCEDATIILDGSLTREDLADLLTVVKMIPRV